MIAASRNSIATINSRTRSWMAVQDTMMDMVVRSVVSATNRMLIPSTPIR
jgi:hypothetical protein